MRTIKTYIVDSFTDKPFKGNPAGVCLLERDLEEETMFSIAKELGLSETAFVVKNPSKENYSIRYFSPVMEIPLCGHATLASAKVLFDRSLELNKIQFVTIQNIELDIVRNGELIKMEFPIYGTQSADAPKALLDALGLEKIVNSEFNQETNILLLEIEDAQILKNLKPDFAALKESHAKINGVLVTAKSDRENYDFESRYFWPWSGTNEDPVTGGTHTFLAKYWSDRLSKKSMNSFQCSERSGFMKVVILSPNKMSIESKAIIIFEGTLKV